MIPQINIDWIPFFRDVAPWGLPLVGALLLLLVGPFWKENHRLHFCITLLTLIASIYMGWQSWLGAQSHSAGLLLFDAITYLFVLFFLVAALLVVLSSYDYLENFGIARPEYYALILFALFGMGCMTAGRDLMVVFVGLEVMSVSAYVLAGFQRSNVLCVEASLKYFLMGAFASAFLLFGIAFLYGASGTTDLVLLRQSGASLFSGDMRSYAMLGTALLLVGLAFKIGVAPFHFWVADVYEGSPIPVTSFMATTVKAAGFAMLLRVLWAVFAFDPPLFEKIIWIGAVATMTVGNISALRQTSIKRMLAYSSIAHAGYALIPLVAFATATESVMASVAFYLLAYIFMTVGAFAVLTLLTKKGEEDFSLGGLQGLGYRRPLLGFALTVFLLSLTGMPPTIGFFGKYFLFLNAIEGGFVWLAILGVLNSLVSVYYYITPIIAMYFGEKEGGIDIPRVPTGLLAVIWVTLLAVLFFGLMPNTLLDIVSASAQSWLVR